MKKSKLKMRIESLLADRARLVVRVQALEAEVITLGTYIEDPPGEPTAILYCACGRRTVLYRNDTEHAAVLKPDCLKPAVAEVTS